MKELVKDSVFDEALSKAELSTWLSLKSVVTNHLGNHQSVEYKKDIEELLKNFHQSNCNLCGHIWTILQRTEDI